MEFDFVSRIPIEKGWSADKKYRVTRRNGETFLLRISPMERYEGRRELFEMQKKAAALGIPMCRPVDFGICEEGVYLLQTWVDGVDAEPLIPTLPEAEQAALGREAGEILRKLHQLPAPADVPDWEERFTKKAKTKIRRYQECPLKIPGGQQIMDYLEGNWALLKNRPQCFQHGDYHLDNMMLEQGKLIIIDFDRFDFGDPWEEFNRIVWCAQASPAFASGMLEGYFGGTPPMEFFRLLAFYIGSNTLSSIYWAIPFGQGEIDTMMNQARDVLRWYDGMRTVVPAWYRGA